MSPLDVCLRLSCVSLSPPGLSGGRLLPLCPSQPPNDIYCSMQTVPHVHCSSMSAVENDMTAVERMVRRFPHALHEPCTLLKRP